MKCRHSTGEPTRWPRGWRAVARRRSSEAATWWPLCRSSTSPSGCLSCRRVGARRSNSSRARHCPASPPCATRIMRRPLIAGNWKMHFTVPEGLEYALQLRRDLEPYSALVDVVIMPPAVMLWEIANALRVWAIGTGKAATPDYANETMGLIRGLLQSPFGALASQIRILYGGSVTPANARSLLEQPEIDGGLVGGASLKPGEFTRIVQATAEVLQSPRV